MDLITTIDQLMSKDNKLRTSAEHLISNLIQQEFYEYLEKMCYILAGENYNLNARQMASTLIKNPIIYLSKYKQAWKEMNTEKKEHIKQLILSTLGSSNEMIRKSAASVIASIAKIETPISEKWSALLPILCQEKFENVSFQLAAIETLGYICEELSKSDILPNEVDQILSAIVLAIKNNLNSQPLVVLGLKALNKVFPLIGAFKMSNKVRKKNYFFIFFNFLFLQLL
jgi:importin subunit beta-1